MKCSVCGHESGKYPLCKACNIKKEQGLIIKCPLCGKWHYRGKPCAGQTGIPGWNMTHEAPYQYERKRALLTDIEREYFMVIQNVLPQGHFVFPQINLVAFIERTDNARYHNELFRNVDFLITDSNFAPEIVMEINDRTHLTPERRERDEKVRNICEEAGIPIVNLWTAYGVNPEYIRKRISETLASLPVTRIRHTQQNNGKSTGPVIDPSVYVPDMPQGRSGRKGCYVATCVYGSYDCPEVWTLRRYRDEILSRHIAGRLFIRFYYAVSPTLVRWFGTAGLFKRPVRRILDRLVRRLNAWGVSSAMYYD